MSQTAVAANNFWGRRRLKEDEVTHAVEYGGINVKYMKERDCKHIIAYKTHGFSEISDISGTF